MKTKLITGTNNIDVPAVSTAAGRDTHDQSPLQNIQGSPVASAHNLLPGSEKPVIHQLGCLPSWWKGHPLIVETSSRGKG